MNEILIAFGVIIGGALVLALVIRSAQANANRAAEQHNWLMYMQEKERAQSEAETQRRAMELYTMQSMIDVVKLQAETQAKAQSETTFALTQAVEALKQDRKTVEALELMRWKAIERSYTALLTDKQKTGERYWEEVNFYD